MHDDLIVFILRLFGLGVMEDCRVCWKCVLFTSLLLHVQPETQASLFRTYSFILTDKPLVFPSCDFFFSCASGTFYPRLTASTLKQEPRISATLSPPCLQLIGQLVCELGHDVVHPDVLFFLRRVYQEDR